jgi:hypothetical protein
MVDEVVDWSKILTRQDRKKCFKMLKESKGSKYLKTFKRCSNTSSMEIATRSEVRAYDFIRRENGKDRYSFEARKGTLTSAELTNHRAEIVQAWAGFLPPPPHIVTEKELANAFRRMLPENDPFGIPGFSLANFIIELKELKDLASLVIRDARTVPEYMSDTFVGVNFGVLPFASDIITMFTMMDRIDHYINVWNDFASRGDVMNWHSTIWKFETIDSVDFSRNAQTLFSKAKTWSGTVSLEYKDAAYAALYIIPKHVSNDAIFKVKLKALGLDRPLSVAWEAVPFSWFIDYLFKIGNMIDDYEDSLSSFDFEIVDAGYSTRYYKREYVVSSYDHTDVATGFTMTPNDMQYGKEKVVYERYPVSPTVAHGLTIPMPDYELTVRAPSPHQTLLSAAVGAMLLRGKSNKTIYTD